MGIPSGRFLDPIHEQFICTVCLDVAVDPQVVNDCEHIFCRKCIDRNKLRKCPTCQERFKLPSPFWLPLQGVSRKVYSIMKIKCLHPDCKQLLKPMNYASHDNNCEVTFEVCPDCELKCKRSSRDEHSCIKEMKQHYEKELDEMRIELQMVKQRVDAMGHQRSGMNKGGFYSQLK